MTINHIINPPTVIPSKINAINEWESNCRDLSTREKRIKTNSAVKINLTAYKNCHNYHLNAIVLVASFIFSADETQEQQSTPYNVSGKYYQIYFRRYLKAIIALKSNL